MHIIVSAAKKHSYIISKYLGHEVRLWHVTPRKPTNLCIGDKIYFAVEGSIIYYHIFKGYAMEPRCELTGRIWPGLNYILTVPQVDVEAIPVDTIYGFKYKEE